ncbi:MAG: sterol desaturase family protein [Campylobacterales bacterium]|nr:sterol desaturase family protein [Campylobacterales bacterium]
MSHSAKIDYIWFFIGFWINYFLILPLFSQSKFNVFLVNSLYDIYTPVELNLSKATILISYTLIVIVLLDLSYYFIHKAMHKNKFLWDCHKFHHSATSLTPITLYRTHPIEYILFGLQKITVIGVVTSLYIYQFEMIIQPVTFYGIGLGTLFFGLAGSNLRHSHIELKYYDWIENIFISPFMHQIHHSKNPKEHHSNFGAIFSFWDNIFGTLNKSKTIKKKLKYGIESYQYDSLIQSMILPIKNIKKDFK